MKYLGSQAVNFWIFPRREAVEADSIVSFRSGLAKFMAVTLESSSGRGYPGLCQPASGLPCWGLGEAQPCSCAALLPTVGDGILLQMDPWPQSVQDLVCS